MRTYISKVSRAIFEICFASASRISDKPASTPFSLERHGNQSSWIGNSICIHFSKSLRPLYAKKKKSNPPQSSTAHVMFIIVFFIRNVKLKRVISLHYHIFQLKEGSIFSPWLFGIASWHSLIFCGEKLEANKAAHVFLLLV